MGQAFFVEARVIGMLLNLEEEPVVWLHFGGWDRNGRREGEAKNMPLSIVFVDGKPVSDINSLKLGQKCSVMVTVSEREQTLRNALWVRMGGHETVFDISELKRAA